MRDRDRLQLAYLAGIIDGEGCISLHRQVSKNGFVSYNPFVKVEMVAQEPIILLQAMFGGKVRLRRTRVGCQPVWYWKVRGDGAYQCLVALCNYLLVKKAQADIVLRVWGIRDKWKHLSLIERQMQEIAAQEMCALNKRGI